MRTWTVSLAAAICLLFTSGLTADDEPTPYEALKEGTRALSKSKSFAYSVHCQGGTAASPQQTRPDKPLVRRHFEVELFRPLTRVEEPQAFVFYGQLKGAVFNPDQSRWMGLLALKEGKELPHLVRAPEQVLATALASARKTGVWLDPGRPTAEWQPPQSKKDGPGTELRQPSGEGEGGVQEAPTTLRVIGPARTALKLILEVQTSGCLSGG